MVDPAKRPASRRVQYAALPWRRNESATEVLLITSRDSGRWIIPKGWPMKRRLPHATAAREALEEAGVLGHIEKTPIGSFSYRKLLKQGRAVVCQVEVFPVCTENLDSDVLMMQPADQGIRHNASNPLNWARDRRIFSQRTMSSRRVVIARIGFYEST
jgi:8-oxo-dGTP pyrophosphatase MutT (NUDIX family)